LFIGGPTAAAVTVDKMSSALGKSFFGRFFAAGAIRRKRDPVGYVRRRSVRFYCVRIILYNKTQKV